MENKNAFVRFSQKISYITGHPACFAFALALVLAWGMSGPIFSFNDTWQLVINTSTTIITFLMVFLIQSTQNRDTAAMQLKLDELVRTTKGAQTALLDIEELSEDELESIRCQYEELARKARDQIDKKKGEFGQSGIDLSHIGQNDKKS